MAIEKKVHLIAIGGSIMHNLAIALKEKGYKVTGSDDGFFEPSKSRLEKHGILPQSTGWNPENITEDLEAVILGMHAKADNPELLKAQDLNLKIYSFPEYIFEQSQNKQRIVIAGSHGKTTITAMVMHVLSKLNREFDYAVGAQLKGFDTMVKLTDAPYIIIEGDEYLSSALDPRPKFFNYHHHMVMITGIAWDHVNVFPTFESYKNQFVELADKTPRAGTIIYNSEDNLVKSIAENQEGDILKFDYKTPSFEIIDGVFNLIHEKKKYPLKINGKHNMSNLGAAWIMCTRLCIRDEEFIEAIQSFEGAGKRLEVLGKTESGTIFRDFAHAPSKLKGTVEGIKDQFKEKQLTGVYELHTFSSLNKDFLSQYNGCFDAADHAAIFVDNKVVESKGIDDLTDADIKNAFNNSSLAILRSPEDVKNYVSNHSDGNILLMSSGNFGGLDINQIITELN